MHELTRVSQTGHKRGDAKAVRRWPLLGYLPMVGMVVTISPSLSL